MKNIYLLFDIGIELFYHAYYLQFLKLIFLTIDGNMFLLISNFRLNWLLELNYI